jgi:hypothetical protein
MLISGHKTRSVFDRYHIIDEHDVETAGRKLGAKFVESARPRRLNLRRSSRGPARQIPSGTLLTYYL